MASGGDSDYDWLYDDPDTINELTKFDDENVGHDFAAMRRLQNAKPSTALHGESGNVPDEPVVYVKNTKKAPPDPSKVANVFREVIFPDSGPRGVAPVDGQGPTKPSSSGRGQRNKKIQERKAQARAAQNKESSLRLIEEDLFDMNISARQKKIFHSMNSKANPDAKTDKKNLSKVSNGKTPTLSGAVTCPSLQSIADSLLTDPKRKSEEKA